MYKFAVVGYGFIGRRHVNTLKNRKDSDCVAVCDRNPQRLKEVQALYADMRVYENFENCLKKKRLMELLSQQTIINIRSFTIQAARAEKILFVKNLQQ